MTDRFVAAWERFWFEPVAVSTIALLRIAVGLLGIGWALSVAADLPAFYFERGFVHRQPAEQPWGLLATFHSDAAVVGVWTLLLVASLSLVVGFRSRLSSLLVFVAMVSLQRRDPFVLNGGDVLVHLLMLYVVLMPSGAWLSVDRWRRVGRERFWEVPERSPWALRLLQLQICIVYLAAVYAKLIAETWRDGSALTYALRTELVQRYVPPDWIVDSSLFSHVMTFATLGVELAIPLLVWNRRTRPWVIAAGIALHVGIHVMLQIGFFSIAMIIAYGSFLPPERATRAVLAVRRRIAGGERPDLELVPEPQHVG
jgi:hypothetical protein